MLYASSLLEVHSFPDLDVRIILAMYVLVKEAISHIYF